MSQVNPMPTIALPVRLTVGDSELLSATLEVPLKAEPHGDGVRLVMDHDALHDQLIELVDQLGETLATTTTLIS